MVLLLYIFVISLLATCDTEGFAVFLFFVILSYDMFVILVFACFVTWCVHIFISFFFVVVLLFSLFLLRGAETDIFLVTPFIDGGEMFDWVSKAPTPAREADVRPLFRQIVEGMQVDIAMFGITQDTPNSVRVFFPVLLLARDNFQRVLRFDVFFLAVDVYVA